jgi:ribokinase
VAAIVVDERGENLIAVASGANAAVDATVVEEAVARLIERGTSGVVLLQQEIPEEVVLAGIRAARAAGWQAVLNPAPARPLPDDLDSVLLTPNADEARALAGEDDVEAAASTLARRTGAPVLVTIGAEGALLLDGKLERLPAPDVEVVDTTGAGDAVNGALAAELAAGRSLRDAARFAMAAAALSTQVAGARDGMPQRDDVLAEL